MAKLGNLQVSLVEARGLFPKLECSPNARVSASVALSDQLQIQANTDFVNITDKRTVRWVKDFKLPVDSEAGDLLVRVETLLPDGGAVMLGRVALPMLAVIKSGTQVEWFKLKDDSGVDAGDICLVLRYIVTKNKTFRAGQIPATPRFDGVAASPSGYSSLYRQDSSSDTSGSSDVDAKALLGDAKQAIAAAREATAAAAAGMKAVGSSSSSGLNKSHFSGAYNGGAYGGGSFRGAEASTASSSASASYGRPSYMAAPMGTPTRVETSADAENRGEPSNRDSFRAVKAVVFAPFNAVGFVARGVGKTIATVGKVVIYPASAVASAIAKDSNSEKKQPKTKTPTKETKSKKDLTKNPFDFTPYQTPSKLGDVGTGTSKPLVTKASKTPSSRSIPVRLFSFLTGIIILVAAGVKITEENKKKNRKNRKRRAVSSTVRSSSRPLPSSGGGNFLDNFNQLFSNKHRRRRVNARKSFLQSVLDAVGLGKTGSNGRGFSSGYSYSKGAARQLAPSQASAQVAGASGGSEAAVAGASPVNSAVGAESTGTKDASLQNSAKEGNNAQKPSGLLGIIGGGSPKKRPQRTFRPEDEEDEEYVVQEGDTLCILGECFNTRWKSIFDDNNLNNPDMIFAGQRLKIRKGMKNGEKEAIVNGKIVTVKPR